MTDTQTIEKTPEQIAEEKARALEVYQVSDRALAPDMADVGAYASRIKKTIPGMADLSSWGAMAAANYGLQSGANLARGEMYAYEDNKGLHIIEGYKLLVRWAKAKCDYSEWYTPLDTDNGIGFTCHILRSDKVGLLQTLVSGGMPSEQAMDIVTTSAVGVVRTGETTKQAPNGWNWEQVAKKRALKNALNFAYGAPSPDELAQETWKVEDTVTIAPDWEGVPEGRSPEEKRETAKYNAKRRAHLRQQSTKTADELQTEAATAVDEVFDFEADANKGNGDAPEVVNGEIEQVEPPDPYLADQVEGNGYLEEDVRETPAHEWTREEATRLFNKTRNEYVIEDGDTLAALGVSQIRDYPGDYDAAIARIDVWIAAQAEVA